jgi:restriction system protein
LTTRQSRNLEPFKNPISPRIKRPAVYRAKKGVFITTSRFAKSAYEYVQQIEHKIVLIDGARLANLMIEFGIGVTTYKEYVLKKLDSDYFED